MKKEEYLDIVDENDKVIDRDTRKNIYRKRIDSQVRVVNVFILNSEGKLLLPKRSINRRTFPGCYDFSCGEHVLSGEKYYEVALRGVREELGLEGVELIELGKFTPRDGVSCFMKVYKVIHDGEINNYDTDGIDRLFWYSLDKVRKTIMKDKKKFKDDFSIVLEKFANQLKNITSKKQNLGRS